MLDRAKCIPLNGATSQYDRFLRVEEDSARIDDRSEAQLLGFSVEFSRLLRFYNLSNEPDGDWSGFFGSDPTIALASVAALNLRSLQEAFDALVKSVASQEGEERKAVALARCFQWLLDLAIQFNGWLAGTEPLFHSRCARMFSAEVRQMIARDLGPALRLLKRYAVETFTQEVPLISLVVFSGFLPVWGLDGESSASPVEHTSHDRRSCEETATALRAIFLALFGAAQRLSEF
ncbi:MAG TPA: hypothetical protein VNH18_01130, partial [Bryobacteraceae bacterium]|nr:hypothetical protein [Bryobacteraceae bacterium]